MRAAPRVIAVEVDDEMAYYTAATALDEVLAWFVDDGYTREQLQDLAYEHAESMSAETAA